MRNIPFTYFLFVSLLYCLILFMGAAEVTQLGILQLGTYPTSKYYHLFHRNEYSLLKRSTG